jgi:FKBP-type peptidyl-prolyl cis-trans isomerase FklB
MKLVKFLPLASVFLLVACETPDNSSPSLNDSESVEINLETQTQKISYLMGLDNGNNIRAMDLDIDAEAFQQGLTTALAGSEPKLTEEQIAETIKQFESEMKEKTEAMQAEQQKAVSAQSDSNATDGAAFLAENTKKEGVVTTDSGLQYKIMNTGVGPKPTADSTVEVHYAGRLLDGTEFDSSVKRGVPTQFGVTQVIPGWTEVLQLMPEGSKWEVYIPSNLAYGPGGTGPIGPNSTLIFEVELLQANVSEE